MHATRRMAALVLAAACTLAAGCASLAPRLTDAAISFERSRADLVRKDVVLPDGLHMAYLEGGKGEPLVLVHGFGGNKDIFARVARFLSPHYRLIVPDLIGFGESSHPQDVPYAYAAQARRLESFVRALSLDAQGPVHFGGNSMGGAVVMSYAAQFPDRVASLWLLDAAGIPEAPASELRVLIETQGVNPLLVPTEDDFARLMKFAMSDPPYVPRAMMNVLAREHIANLPLERRVFEQIAPDSLTQQVRGLRTPALIVWGAQDRLLDVRTAAILHCLLPHSQVVVMPGVGHMPMLERPRQSAQDYLAFRASVRGSAAAAGAARCPA